MAIYPYYHFINGRETWRTKQSSVLRKKLIKTAPVPEKILYQALKKELAGICTVMRQKVIFTPKSFYIADLFLRKYKIIVEVDGEYHNTPQQRALDKEREKHFLRRKDYRIIRFTNSEILSNPAMVMERILKLRDKAA